MTSAIADVDAASDSWTLLDPPRLNSDREYTLFAEALSASGFSTGRVESLVGSRLFPAPSAAVVHDLSRRFTGFDPLATFVRLFLCGCSVRAEVVQQCCSPLTVEALVEGRVLRRFEGQVSTAVKLLPYDGFVLASDPPCHAVTDTPTNWVMGVGQTSHRIREAMRPPPAKLALDLGTGCGNLALAASRVCDSVLAIDRNPRAIGFTEFNARLNGVANIKAEVADIATFGLPAQVDYVVSNPPFVLTPERLYEYCSLGESPLETPRAILRACTKWLQRNGKADLLVDWPQLPSIDWRPEFDAFIRSLRCEASVSNCQTIEAEAYAKFWIETTESAPETRLPIWMQHLDDHQIECVHNLTLTVSYTGIP